MKDEYRKWFFSQSPYWPTPDQQFDWLIANASPKGKEEERFKMPTDKQVVDFAIVFNDGKMERKKLADMVGFLQMIVDRLYENGDILIPSSKENQE